MTNTPRAVSIAFAALVFSVAPVITPAVAHAADYGYYPSYTDSIDYSYPSYDYYTPSYTSSIDYSYPSYDYYTPSYTSSIDYSYPSYSYSTPSYSYPSYSYSSPGFYSNYGFAYGPSGSTGGGSQTQTQTQQQQQTQTTTVTNTNTNNNTVTVNIPATQVVQPVNNYYNTYTQPACQSGWYGTYPNCYKYNPVVYNNPTTPYVTLSQVPYTGLELGPVGTALYWGFLALWAFFIAYLLVVKRVQTGIYRSLNSFLFGSPTAERSVEKSAEVTAPTFSKNEPVSAKIPSGVDPFIAAQISRARA
ncbi:hypothetical protein HYS79_01600 [Patescibacteria group bacterium]|nr:hypothetical protein [Patescibacteria group bacterium]